MVQPIGRESIDSFSGAIHPSRTQHTTLRCTALSKCACSPLFLTIGSICEITSMRRKKRALRDPTGLTLDTLRSFFKPAPISSQEIDNMKKRLERYDPSVTQNERGDLVVLGL